ncbi:MAG: hypothetical protein NVS9B10_02510 [Nevskia sp.]
MLGLTLDDLTQGGSLDCRNGLGGEVALDRMPAGTVRARQQDGDSGQQLESLVRTIESEIIPRLMLAHRDTADVALRLHPGIAEISPADVAAFTRLVLTTDIAVVVTAVESLRARGIKAEALCMKLLAPTARRLGELWEADLADFIEVTVGLGRLQQVLHELVPALHEEDKFRASGHRILLAPAPGDQHSLGLSIVREFFRVAGWEVRGGSTAAESEVREMLRAEWFDAAGLSVGSECRLEAVAAFIRYIRKTASNRNIGILVGGPIFVEHPEYVHRVGADATAADAPQAVAKAEAMIASRR